MRALISVALFILVAGCGGNSDEPAAKSPQVTPSSPASSSTKCADIWVAGQTLPKGYESCVRDDGDLEAGISDECADGSELFVYADKFWALGGGKITGPVDAVNTPEYQAASKACTG